MFLDQSKVESQTERDQGNHCHLAMSGVKLPLRTLASCLRMLCAFTIKTCTPLILLQSHLTLTCGDSHVWKGVSDGENMCYLLFKTTMEGRLCCCTLLLYRLLEISAAHSYRGSIYRLWLRIRSCSIHGTFMDAEIQAVLEHSPCSVQREQIWPTNGPTIWKVWVVYTAGPKSSVMDAGPVHFDTWKNAIIVKRILLTVLYKIRQMLMFFWKSRIFR